MDKPASIEERLACYLDGEMTAEEIGEFEAEIAADPALAERLAQWRHTDQAIAADVDLLLNADLPTDVSAIFAGSQSGQVIEFAQERSQRPAAATPSRHWLVPGAIAASLCALILGYSIPSMIGGSLPLDALETLPAGQRLALDDGRNLTAVLTFAAADGRWCREFMIEGSSRGVACRHNGEWLIEAESLPSGPSQDPGGTGYVTAAGEGGAALDEAYARLGAGDPLGLTEEARLLESGWTDNED